MNNPNCQNLQNNAVMILAQFLFCRERSRWKKQWEAFFTNLRSWCYLRVSTSKSHKRLCNCWATVAKATMMESWSFFVITSPSLFSLSPFSPPWPHHHHHHHHSLLNSWTSNHPSSCIISMARQKDLQSIQRLASCDSLQHCPLLQKERPNLHYHHRIELRILQEDFALRWGFRSPFWTCRLIPWQFPYLSIHRYLSVLTETTPYCANWFHRRRDWQCNVWIT